MGKSAKTKLKWEKWRKGEQKGSRIFFGKYELIIFEGNVDGIKTFQSCVYSHHTGKVRLFLFGDHAFGPKTRLREIKQSLMEDLKLIIAKELKSLAQIFTDDELKKIGLTRT